MRLRPVKQKSIGVAMVTLDSGCKMSYYCVECVCFVIVQV